MRGRIFRAQYLHVSEAAPRSRLTIRESVRASPVRSSSVRWRRIPSKSSWGMLSAITASGNLRGNRSAKTYTWDVVQHIMAKAACTTAMLTVQRHLKGGLDRGLKLGRETRVRDAGHIRLRHEGSVMEGEDVRVVVDSIDLVSTCILTDEPVLLSRLVPTGSEAV